MSEKEKRIVEKLKDAIPKMSEFDKGYILGKTESFSEKKMILIRKKRPRKEHKWTHYNLTKPSASTARNLVETVANATYGFTVTYRQVSDQMS